MYKPFLLWAAAISAAAIAGAGVCAPVGGSLPPAAGAAVGAGLGGIGAAPISAADLSAVAGAGDTSINSNNIYNGPVSDQELSATVTNNSMINSITNGVLSIGPSAFQGFSGIGNFVLNTGSLSSLQGAVIVNVITAPPAQ
jgi:hypothetical protein